MRRLPIAVLMAALLSAPLLALDPTRAMSQYLRDHWGPEQGFPRGAVYAIGQSDDGYLWVGTEAGLVRFDGVKFRLVQDVPGLESGKPVLGLMSDNRGNLWIRMRDYLLRYRNGVFNRPTGQATSRISALSQSQEGYPVVATTGDGTVMYREGAIQPVIKLGELPRSPVLAITQTRDGTLWAGTRGAGLFRRRGDRMEPVLDGFPEVAVNCFGAAANRVLVGTDTGIFEWDGTRVAPVGPPALRQFQVLALQSDRDGNIWAGTDSHGLIRVNKEEAAFLDPPTGRTPDAVTAVFEDRESNLWTGSANGLERLRDGAFLTYSQSEGMPASGGGPILVDEEGRLWSAPTGGGLYWMKDGRRERVSVAGLDHDIVYSIAGGKGEVWLARQRGGLTRLNLNGSSLTTQTFTKAAGLAQDSVFSVFRSRDGSIWAGTLSGGVSKLSGENFTTYNMVDGLASNTVAAILEDSAGRIWLATPGGLNSLAKGRWRTFTHGEGLPSDNIYCLFQDASGVLWIGTARGLAWWSSGRVQTPTDVPDFFREAILGIAEDRLGHLWLATSHHALRVNRQRLLQGALQENDVREYDSSDGLHGSEGVRRQPSVTADADGRIWFSLSSGISVVDPERLARGLAPAIAQVQSLFVNEREVPLTLPLQIAGGPRRVTLAYTGMGLSAPARLRFRYRLDGYDNRWSEPTTERQAAYTNLAPRTYRFHVMASNPDGDWNGRETTLAFEVEPLLWQTWWFRAAAAFLCLGAIVAFYSLRLRRLARQLNLRFEERLAERTRIAQELHDTLLQGFMSASMQVHVAHDTLPADSPARKTLTRALQLMRQVTDEGRNAVRGLRSSTNTSLDLESALALVEKEFPERIGEARTGFRVLAEGRRRPLHPLLRDEIYRIGREALLNAFRHARAKNIEVELQYLPNQLRLLVRDDGVGIEPQIIESGRDGHWGLVGMRERAEQIGGRLRVYSRPDGGTEVDLTIPGHIAFREYVARRSSK